MAMLNIARLLLLFTIFYNVAEGIIAVWSGIVADSFALVFFGADSCIEVAAAALVLWRVGITDGEYAEAVEQRVVRFIGWTFIALSSAIVLQSSWALSQRSGAEESLVGIGLAVASVTLMPLIAVWKLRVAAQGNLQSLAIEAKETFACAVLSLTLLLGLVANATLGWWWLDAVTALFLVPWLFREGLDGIRRGGVPTTCCCTSAASANTARKPTGPPAAQPETERDRLGTAAGVWRSATTGL